MQNMHSYISGVARGLALSGPAKLCLCCTDQALNKVGDPLLGNV